MKLKHLILVASVALFTACTNQESLVKDFENACEKGDLIEASKIETKMRQKFPNDADWTQEQKDRIRVAKYSCLKKR